MDELQRKKPTGRRLDAGVARRLSVAAECHPETIQRVYRGGEVKSISSARAKAILERDGYLPAGQGVAA